jgi:hypothetical protein
MVRGKIVELPLSEVKVTFYVRRALDDDRVILFGEIYEQGGQLPPIKVTRDTHQLIDGRHRVAACELINRATIECELVPEADKVHLIAEAFRANSDGALPPSREDIAHTIRLLIEEKVSVTKIVETLPFPASLVRRYVTNVKSDLKKRQFKKALGAVADGDVSVTEAAVQYNVEEKKLRESIRGAKKRGKAGVAETNGTLTSMFRSHSQKISKVTKRVVEAVADHEMTPEQGREVMEHIAQLIERMTKSFNQWGRRLDVTANSRAGRRKSKS